MRKTTALLLTLALAASCTQQELPVPVLPQAPDSDALIVPALSIANGSAEVSPWHTPTPHNPAGWTATRTATRATTYPYAAVGSQGNAPTVLVSADRDGQAAGATFHGVWTETPTHHESHPYNALSPRLEVAKADIYAGTDPASIPWADAVANHCKSPWRFPTLAELKYINTHISKITGVAALGYDSYYWTATDKDGDPTQVYWVAGGKNNSGTRPKTGMSCRIRCVRDAYPYVAPNAEGKMSVIVSHDQYGTSGALLHAPWLQTPQHVGGTAPVPVSYSFEVAQTDASTGAKWTVENDHCPSPWRRPTRDELVAIVYGGLSLGITPLDNKVYWSSTTEIASSNAVGIYNPGNPEANGRKYAGWAKNNASYSWNTRCVRDTYAPFPGTTPGTPIAPGTVVGYLWGYTNTTGAYADRVIDPVGIKTTATGYELDTKRYYPANGKKLYFYAYAPGVGTTGNVDANTATLTHTLNGQVDLLHAKDVRGIAKSSDPALQEQPFLVFNHKLMRLAFKVVADGSLGTRTPAVTNITLKGVNTKSVMKLITGEVTFNTPGTLSIAPIANNTITPAGTLLTDVILAPPSVTVTLSVTAGGVLYDDVTLTLTGPDAGKEGISHLITLTFKQNLIVPTAAVIPWEEGEGGEGELI